jgi:hypothetical protein
VSRGGRRTVIAFAVIAVAVAVAITATLNTGNGGHRSVVAAQPAQSTAPSGCAPSSASPSPPPGQPVAPAASVTVPGADLIDTKGLVPAAVTETADGAAWAIVRDPRATQPDGMVARIDVGTHALTEITPVVTGCTATALAAHGTSLWVASCNPAATGDTAGGAELIHVDARGQIGARIALPTSCVDAVAVGDTTVWATSAPRSATAPRLFRVDQATGHVDAVPIGAGEQLTGFATLGDDLWSARTTTAGSRLVRTDGHSIAETNSVATNTVRLLGISGTDLWTEDNQHSALGAHDTRTGALTATVPIPNLQAATVGASGVWFEQASTTSLQITIGHLAGTVPAPVVTFTGAGPDRTGLPFLGTLTATVHGAWLATQDQLFAIGAAGGP